MNFARLLWFAPLIACGAFAQAQTTPDIATGLSPYATYIPGDIDNVNPVNGNVFVKIPLLSYPQRGGKLKLDYYIYYNDKQWQANLSPVSDPPGSKPTSIAGQWTPAGLAQSTAYPTLSPAGAYVARDQFAIYNTKSTQSYSETGGTGGDTTTESTSYITRSVTTPDGAIHFVGDGFTENVSCEKPVPANNCPQTPGSGQGSIINQYLANDGSGYDPFGHDPTGIYYNGSTVSDPNGNSITESSSGWADTYNRAIPGTATGPGAEQFPNATGLFVPVPFGDLIPGTPSECPNGSTSGRIWTVPASETYGTGVATYYLCYTSFPFQTDFNLSGMMPSGNLPYTVAEGTSSSGMGEAVLLTAVILPDEREYTFNYDNYLSLIEIGLPSGGTISYQWQKVLFNPYPAVLSAGPASWGGMVTPVSRALLSRTVNPQDGQPSITTTYHWYITPNSEPTGGLAANGVQFPAYSVVTDSNGNDTEYTLGGPDDNGMFWPGYLTTAVAYYSGCSPHDASCTAGTGTRLKSVTYALTSIAGSGASSHSPAFIPQVFTVPPTTVIQTTTHMPSTSGDLLSKVHQTLIAPNGSCTVYEYPVFADNSPTVPTTTLSGCSSTAQVSTTSSYDFGSPASGSIGALLKTETKTYAWQTTPKVLADNLLDLVSTDVVSNGSAAWTAETDSCYDANGNNTSVLKFVNAPAPHSCSSTPSGALVTSAVFSPPSSVNPGPGVVTSTTDARGSITTYSNFACNGSLPATILLPDGNQMAYQYDCNTGKVAVVQDQNGITNKVSTTYTYNDPLSRVTHVSYPDGGSAGVNYNGDTLPLRMTVTTATGEAAGPSVSTKIYDGLAREIHSEVSDAISTSVPDTLLVDTNYDDIGRVATVSNPYRSKADITYGLSTTSYDTLNRVLEVRHPDNTFQTFAYNGSTVTFSDEVGNQWQRISDSLGRLKKVVEPNGAYQAASLPTNYSYDALGNLKSVNQVGAGGIDVPRNRSFSYDGLSRLTAVNNPETAGSGGPQLTLSGASGLWTTVYSYDGNGNVLSRKDNRGVTTTYSYDSMNRLLSKLYSSGDPSACYQYNTPISSLADSYPSGYLELEWTQSGTCLTSAQSSAPAAAITSTAFSHDPMGRVNSERSCPLGPCSVAYQFNYTYDFAGNMTSSNNGMPMSGSSATSPAISWFETYDAANRLSQVGMTSEPWSDNLHPPVLFEANQTTYSLFGNVIPYDPFGHLVRANLGVTSTNTSGGIEISRQYDKRARLISEVDSGSTDTSIATGSLGTITVNGAESALFMVQPAGASTKSCLAYDTGSLSATISSSAFNYVATASWGKGDTSTSVASKLTSAINSAAGTVVTATLDPTYSNYIDLLSKGVGSSTDYTIAVAVTDTAGNTYPYFLSNPSFVVAGDNLVGGTNQDSTYGTIYSYNAGYTANGNVLLSSDSVMGDWQYNYDTLNRLTLATAGANVPAAYANSHGCWNYDAFGNRTQESYQTTPCYSFSNPALYNSNNQVANGFSYDVAGDVTGDGLNLYAYDAEGRICAVENYNSSYYQYVYDARGSRVAKGGQSSLSCPLPTSANGFRAQAFYLRGSAGNQDTELNGSGFWQHTNYFGNGAPMATYSLAGQAFTFHLTDPLGSRRVLATAQGVVSETCQNLPYGDGESCTATPTEQLFTGKERDAESGNDYFGARYYASNMGRFMSADPSGLLYADPTNPQSLNLYSYGQNNPLINIDPNGLDCIHINNDTGAYEGFESGDCDNSTEEKANSGQYVDGTVSTIYTSTGDSSGVVTGYSGTNGDTGALIAGTFASPLDAPLQPLPDPDEQRIDALVQGVATDTASMPWLCNTSVSVRGQIPKTPFAVGLTADKNGVQPSARAKLGENADGVQVNLTTNGKKVGYQLSAPIVGTPFRGTLSTGNNQATVGVSRNLPFGGNSLSVSGSLTLGYLGDAHCRN
jgi:RHS repeat-associated protein